MAVKKIFVTDAVALVGAVSINLVSNQAKNQKFFAEVTDDSGIAFLVCDEAANEKLFRDAGAAVKFIAPYCDEGATVTAQTDASDYVKIAAAGDPTKTLTRAIDKVTAEIARLTAIVTKLNASIAAATALGWDVGSAAQRAKLADDQERVGLVSKLNIDMGAKLAALQAQVAP